MPSKKRLSKRCRKDSNSDAAPNYKYMFDPQRGPLLKADPGFHCSHMA